MPPYARIAAEIRRRITAGELRPGEQVPSTRAITREWGVAIATATKALNALREEGLVRAVPGVGTVVSAAPRQAVPHTGGAGPVRDRIVRAAIRLADAEGLTAVTMRRIAADLGVATMSLYRHVQNKGSLVTLMAQTAFAEKPLPEPPSGWRARLETSARTQRDLYLRHPWLAQAMNLNRPLLIPSSMLHIEWALCALEGLGLDDDTRLHAAITLFGYVRGNAVDLESERQAGQDTGMDGEQWLDSQDETMAAILADGPFPTFAAIRRGPGVDVSVDSLFEFGLARLLDGIAALIDGDRIG
ncbi:TetR/AcrR family transcriptional regulator C-terminal domain-containing protein [Streptosporangium sp. CA-135522]|uniref:TetR/AcrR family transcriptional regulator C-terminal domain-containing protein n=1 Tax=Streptosporangium sp. CA-135522 TaxID=3240072 RepID=UPI003D8D6C9F